MIINRIILKNFKRFREQEIRFKDGITGILGNNGTGKSSIVEGIFFALYGVQATGISGDYIVSSFASPREGCEVRLDFRIGGDTYTVIRTFKKGKYAQHDARFYRGTSLRATGVSQVETEVRRVLGMSPVDFRNTVYAAQKDLLTLLENTPGKRKEWFLRALGIDYLKNESDKILKERADIKGRDLQLVEGELKGLAERLDASELENLQASVNTFKATLKDLITQHGVHIEKKKQADDELRQFLERKTEYTRLFERQQSLTNETGGLVRQKDLITAQLSGLPVLEQEYHALEQSALSLGVKKQHLDILRKQKSDFEQLRTEQRFAERDCADIKTRIEKNRVKIAALDEDTARLASLRTGIRSVMGLGPEVPDNDLEKVITYKEAEVLHTIGTLTARADRLVTERKKLQSDWEIIKNAGADGVCPLCHQTLGSHYSEIRQEFTSRLELIEQEALTVRLEQKRIAEEKDRIGYQKPVLSEARSISEKLKTRGNTEAELKDLLSQMNKRETAHQSFTTRMKEIGYDEALFLKTQEEVAELEKVQAHFIEIGKKIARGAVLRKQVSDLDNQISQKQDEIAGLILAIEESAYDPETGTRLEQVLAVTDSAIRTAETEMARTTERLRHAEEKIVLHRKDEAKITGLKQSILTIKEEIDLLRLTRTVIADYVIYLMQVVRSRIEGEVSRIISEITGGRYEQVLLDEEFNLLVRDIDEDYAIDRFSGGEQDDIAVALRIALSRYLAELHQVHESTLLIFDEIFGSQDEERRTNLLTSLRTQESRFPQIILISHISEMQGEFTNTLVVEMGADLTSRVKEVA